MNCLKNLNHFLGEHLSRSIYIKNHPFDPREPVHRRSHRYALLAFAQ